MLYDAKGRPYLLPDLSMVPSRPSGAPTFGWRRLSLATISASGDPASRLTGVVTDGGEGTGISAPLTASWQSADAPGNYPYLTWPLLDMFGHHVGGDVVLQVWFCVRLRGTWTETDDIVAGLSLSTESAYTGSTIEGKGVHLIANGAGGAGVVATGNSSVNNGSGTQQNATGQSGVVAALGSVQAGGGSTGRLWCSGTIGLDTNGAVVASSGTAALGAVTLAAPPSQWFLHAYFGRVDNTNASTKTVTADFYYSPPLFVGLPTM